MSRTITRLIKSPSEIELRSVDIEEGLAAWLTAETKDVSSPSSRSPCGNLTTQERTLPIGDSPQVEALLEDFEQLTLPIKAPDDGKGTMDYELWISSRGLSNGYVRRWRAQEPQRHESVSTDPLTAWIRSLFTALEL